MTVDSDDKVVLTGSFYLFYTSEMVYLVSIFSSIRDLDGTFFTISFKKFNFVFLGFIVVLLYICILNDYFHLLYLLMSYDIRKLRPHI